MAKQKIYASMTKQEKFWGWCYALFELVFLPGLLVRGNALLPQPLSGAWLNFIYYGMNFLFLLLILRSYLKKSLTVVGKGPWPFLKAVILSFALYYLGSALLALVLTWVAPGFANVNDAAIGQMAQGNFLIMAIGTVVLVPVAEECIFRGLIFHGLYRHSQVAAYLVSALAFCAIHVLGYVGSFDPLTLVLCFVQYLPAGLCLAFAYEESGTIFAPIIMHTVINAIGIWSVR